VLRKRWLRKDAPPSEFDPQARQALETWLGVTADPLGDSLARCLGVGPWPGEKTRPGARAGAGTRYPAILDDAGGGVAWCESLRCALLGTLGVCARAKKARPGGLSGRRLRALRAAGLHLDDRTIRWPWTYRRELVETCGSADCRIRPRAAKGGRTGLPHKTLAEALNVPNPPFNPPLDGRLPVPRDQAATQSGWTAASSGVLMLDESDFT